MKTAEAGSSERASNLADTARLSSWPSAVEVATAASIGLAAVDEARLDFSPTTLLQFLRVVVAIALFAALATSGSLRQMNRREPALTMLGGWLVWAAIASAAAHGGLNAMTHAGLFALVAGGLIASATSSGSIGLARIGVLGFAGYLVVSAVLIAGGALEAYNDDNRLMLASLEPNQLARAGAIAVVCGLWLVIRGNRSSAFIGAAVSLAAVGTILASGSRTGLAALLVGIAVLAVHGSRRLLSASALVVLLALGSAALLSVVGFGPSSVSITERLEQSPEGATSTLSGRDTLWPEIWDIALDQPVTGHGIGTDRRLIAQNLDVGWGPQHAHNFPLHVFLTTGAVGVVVLALAIGRGLWLAARQQRPLEFALLLIVIVDGISEPVIRVPSFGWLALAGSLAVVAHEAAPRLGAEHRSASEEREPHPTSA